VAKSIQLQFALNVTATYILLIINLFFAKINPDMNFFNTGWYLIYTRSQQERKVSDRLLERNIQTYLPLTIQRRKWKDRVKTLHCPLFPSYLFVYLKNVHEYYEGASDKGSCYFVKNGNQPTRISENQISNIQIVEKNGQNVEVTSQMFQAGQQLIIKQGPFAGLPCEVIHHKGRNRILVRVEILHQSLIADLQSDSFL
jgi:transcriptional antiterminator RfaH